MSELTIEDIEIDWSKNCYNPDTHDCDGRYQGATNCELAKYYKGIRADKPTRKEMIKHKKEDELNNIKWNKFLKSEEGQKMLKEIEEEMNKEFGEDWFGFKSNKKDN